MIDKGKYTKTNGSYELEPSIPFNPSAASPPNPQPLAASWRAMARPPRTSRTRVVAVAFWGVAGVAGTAFEFPIQ